MVKRMLLTVLVTVLLLLASFRRPPTTSSEPSADLQIDSRPAVRDLRRVMRRPSRQLVGKVLTPHADTAGTRALFPSSLSEDFEGTWPGAGWELLDLSDFDGGEFLVGQRDCRPRSGQYAGWTVGGGEQGYVLRCSEHYPDDAETWAIYGPFSLAGAKDAELSFYLYGISEYEEDCAYDHLFVGASTDGVDFGGERICGDHSDGPRTNGYTRVTLGLDGYLGQSQVWVAFLFTSDGSVADVGFTIDDIALDVRTGPGPSQPSYLALILKPQPTATPVRSATPTASLVPTAMATSTATAMPTPTPTMTPRSVGGEIVFSTTKIGVVNADGSNLRRLSAPNEYDRDPDWSPDGQRIVYECQRGPDRICVMDADGSDVTELSPPTGYDEEYYDPQWSPDGEKIVLAADDQDNDTDIYVMSADGTNLRRLTSHPGRDADPSWAPGGEKIVYALWMGYDKGGQIRVMNADGTNDVVLAQALDMFKGPGFSPDGTKIVYFVQQNVGPREIYLMNADGSNPVRLREGAYPTWSPDGNRIAFTRMQYETTDLCMMNADGSGVVRILDETVFEPDWRP